MKIADFKSKHVPGLYSFDHFEHENGAFIQRHVSGSSFVFRDAQGNYQTFEGPLAFSQLVEAVEASD